MNLEVEDVSTMAAVSETRGKVGYLIIDKGPREVLAFCPGCKTMEAVSLVGRAMTPSRRFLQKGDAVYHACGSDVPCRLYSLS